MKRLFRTIFAAACAAANLVLTGSVLAQGAAQQFAGFIQSEMAKWGKVAKTAGIQPE